MVRKLAKIKTELLAFWHSDTILEKHPASYDLTVGRLWVHINRKRKQRRHPVPLLQVRLMPHAR